MERDYREDLEKQYSAWSTEDLIKAASSERDDYEAEAIGFIHAELARRGVSYDGFDVAAAEASHPPETAPRRWWIAGILSVLQPGLGQIYNGQAKKAALLYLALCVMLPVITILALVKHLSLWTLSVFVLAAVAGFLYVLLDAVFSARKLGQTYALKRYNKAWLYVGIFVCGAIFQNAGSSIIKHSLVQAFKLPAASMEPTLLVGDYILVDKLRASSRNLKRGDVIVFAYPSDPKKDFVKRIAGLSGDIVEMRNKRLFVNGAQVNEGVAVHNDDGALAREVSPRDNYGPVTVPPESLFMLGDNRDRSLDSRFWGFVHQSQVKGPAKLIYFSWDKDNYRVRWPRIGQRVQ